MRDSFLTWYTAMLAQLPPKNIDLAALQSAGNLRAETIENPNTTRFWKVLADMPSVTPTCRLINQDVVTIGAAIDIPKDCDMHQLMQGLMPWRKGPFSIFGTDIDTEWRSHMKWDRLAPALPNLKGKKVLDIGCGSGYYMCRLAALAPALVLGADPSDLFLAQWIMLSRYLFPFGEKELPAMGFLPFGYEKILGHLQRMDVVLAMGVLYHQRSPLHFLIDLKSFLKKGGTLFLETLIIDSPDDVALFPVDRYAKMRNVYFFPSLSCLKNLCTRAGWTWDAVVDVSVTTSEEQRRTPWIKTESLADFLDPNDPTKTVEGYPAPMRALIKLSLI
jgi:tRNA (mo5U34)-methyltransferase